MGFTFKTNLADRNNYGSSRNVSTINYLVYHYTANDGDTDEANGKYFANNTVKASAHYFVDDDSVTQSVPEEYTAYHCGANIYYHQFCRNANSIGIEMCDTIKNGVHDVSEQTLTNSIELGKNIMKKYNIPIENVLRHYDVTHKICPAYFVTNEVAWQSFKKRLYESLNDTNVNSTIGSVSTVNIYRIRKSWSDVSSQIGAYSSIENAKSACKDGYSVFDNNGNVVYSKANIDIEESINPNTYTHKDFIKEVQTAIGAKVDGIAGSETLSKTVTVSMINNNRHAVVKPIQKYLNCLGYSCGVPDGIAGLKFDYAVKAFQKANGCIADGEITKSANTWKKLLKL